jgi:hypothetical protein
MALEGQQREDAEIIIGALQVARERVVGDTIAVKEERRQALKDAISRMYLHVDTGQGGPVAGELRELLGDPDDRVVRRALEEWAAAS